MKVNVYYSDLAIFPGLKEVLTQFNKMYKVIEYCTNFMVVEWKEASVGVGGMKTKTQNL